MEDLQDGPIAIWPPVTRWVLSEIRPERGRPWTGLEVSVVVDTTAPVVVRAIEDAAKAHGLMLRREP